MKVLGVTGVCGAGKTTVIKMLAKELGWYPIYVGQIFRDKFEGDKEALTENGELAPEDWMRSQVASEVQKAYELGCEGVIIDGMPRIPSQVSFLKSLSDDVQVVIIKANLKTVTSRLANRGREDDTDNMIKARVRKWESDVIDISLELLGEEISFAIYQSKDLPNMSEIITSKIIKFVDSNNKID